MTTANPFIYDRPLSPEDAIDRPDERTLLADLAEGGQTSRLAAPRRFGQTTLITALAAERATGRFRGTSPWLVTRLRPANYTRRGKTANPG